MLASPAAKRRLGTLASRPALVANMHLPSAAPLPRAVASSSPPQQHHQHQHQQRRTRRTLAAPPKPHGPWSEPVSPHRRASLNRYLVVAEDYADAGALARRLEVRERHLDEARLGKMTGRVELGGALLRRDFRDIDEDEGPVRHIGGSALVVLGESVEDVRQRLSRDEYSTAAVFDPTRTRIFPFLQAAIDVVEDQAPLGSAAASANGLAAPTTPHLPPHVPAPQLRPRGAPPPSSPPRPSASLTLGQLRSGMGVGVGSAAQQSRDAATAATKATAATFSLAGLRSAFGIRPAAAESRAQSTAATTAAAPARGVHTSSAARQAPASGGAAAGATSAPRSACPEGTTLSGLSILKDRPDPVARPDDAYPAWLWELASGGGGAEGDAGAAAGIGVGSAMSKGEARVAQKRAMKAARAAQAEKLKKEQQQHQRQQRQQAKRAQDAGRAGDEGAAAEAAAEGEQRLEQLRREERARASEEMAGRKRELRKANKASIKAANFVSST